ncbi:MAG: hypothetical protein ACYC3S_14090 [Chloroflexota bacterium]
MQGAIERIGSERRASRRGRAQRSQPEFGGAFWTLRLPCHWVVEAQDRLWEVPAVCGGWSARAPYGGSLSELHPFSTRTAAIIRRLLPAE